MRGVNQAIILATAHNPDEQDTTDWAALARTGQPIVLYMAVRTLEAIVAALLKGGLAGSTPAAIVASASLPEQRVLDSTLATLVDDARAGKIGAPAIVVIGEIVRHRQPIRVSRE